MVKEKKEVRTKMERVKKKIKMVRRRRKGRRKRRRRSLRFPLYLRRRKYSNKFEINLD
jgi:hypothetical protein